MHRRSRTGEGGRLIAFLLTAVLLLGAVVAIGAGSAAATGTTYVVDQGGGGDFTTIQAALDASADGDTVEVRPGTYREQVSVVTNVRLVAPAGATLNGSTLGDGSVGISIAPTLSAGTVVEGFTIEYYGDGIGVGTSAVEDSPGYHYDDYQEDTITGGWTVSDVVVRYNAEDGIDVAPADTAWTIRDVQAVHNGDDGIEAGGFGGTGAWTIRGANASVNRDVGITVGGSSGDWHILDSRTNDNFDGLGIGVYILSRESAWTIGNHTASGNSFYGIDVAGSFSGAWTIHNSTLSDNSGSGLNAHDVESNWVVRDTVLSGNYDWGLRAGTSPDQFRLERITVRDNSLGGIAATDTTGQWRIDDSIIENNGDYRGRFGLDAEYTEGLWTVANTSITGNVNGGINAQEGANDRPTGDATDNWWGQPGGPLTGQCIGRVDCSAPLAAPPGENVTAVLQGTVTNTSGNPLDGILVVVYRDDGTGTFVKQPGVGTDTSGAYNATVDVPTGETSVDVKVLFGDPDDVYASRYYDDAVRLANATVVSVPASGNSTVDEALPVEANVTAPAPEISVSPTSFLFANTDIGATDDGLIDVSNDGQRSLSVTGISLSGGDAAAFEVASGFAPVVVQPGETHTVTVRFEPTTIGTKNATLEVASNDTSQPVATAMLSGAGTSPPEVTVSPGSVDFGDLAVGANTTANVSVRNDGGLPLSVDAALSGSSGGFRLEAGGGSRVLQPGGSQTVTVAFEPTVASSLTGSLEISTNDSDEQLVVVSLVGNGTVTVPNAAPVAVADSYAVLEGTWHNLSAPGVLANDGDPNNDTFAATHHGQPDNGSLASFTSSGAFAYKPDPGFTGTDTFVYRVRDSEGAYSSFVPVTIEVRPDPNRAPEAIPDTYAVHAGEWLNVSGPGRLGNDADPDGDSFAASHHGSPSHGTLARSAQDGSFEYKPDPGFTGTDSYVYRVRDEHGAYSEFASVTIEVLPEQNRAPTAVEDAYTVSQGEWLNVSGPGRLANDYDIDGDTFSASHHGSPSHGTLARSAQDGSFNYKPDAGFTGTDSYVYRIQDEHGEYSGFAEVTIEVVAGNREPTVLEDRYGVLAGDSLNVTAPGRLGNDYDVDGDSFAASHHGSPDNGTLSRSAQDGSFDYAPDPGFVGTDSYVYRVRDEHGAYSGFGTVTFVVVDPATTAPVAVQDHYTVREGRWLNVSGPGRLQNDVDPNGDAFSASHHGSPQNGTLARSAQDGSFNYRPDPGFVGTDSYVYRVRDATGEYSAFAQVIIEVRPDPNATANRAPTVLEDRYTVPEGEWLNVSGPGRLANDYDIDGDTFSASHHGSPSHGTLARSAQDGSFEYKPDQGFTGTDSYVYRVRDEHGEYSGFGTVTIEVVPDGNRAPMAIDDRYAVRSGEWLNVTGPGRLDNDADPDGDSFDASHHGFPNNGTLVRSVQDGSFEYKPDQGFTGTDSYVYRVRDEHGAYSGFATVTIDVLPDPNRAPSAVADAYVVRQGETLTVGAPGRLGNDYDPDGDSFAASHHGSPDNGTLVRSVQDGGLEYTPDPGFVGVDQYVYRIRDAHGAYSGFAPVTITVMDTAQNGYAQVAVLSDAIDYGPVSAGSTRTERVTVANVGDRNLTVHGATITGADADRFAVVGGNDTSVLGYGGTKTLRIAYSPTGVGSDTATLTFLTSDPDERAVTVPLTGSGEDDAGPVVTSARAVGTYRNGSTVVTNGSMTVEATVGDEVGTVASVDLSLESRTATFAATKAGSYDATSGNWTASFAGSDVPDDGAYDVVVRARDDSWNRVAHTATDSVRYDRMDPSVATTVSRLNASAALVAVEATESLRPGSVTLDVTHPDGTVERLPLTSRPDGWNSTLWLSTAGQYEFVASGIDRAGNRGTDTARTLLANVSTRNNSVTVLVEPSDIFVEFRTKEPVAESFVTVTESNVTAAPLVDGRTGIQFLDAELGRHLSANLSSAEVGIPVDPSLLPPGTAVEDVTIRHYNETTDRWLDAPTSVENATVNGTTRRYWVATVADFSTYGAIAADGSPPAITDTTPTTGHEFQAGTSTATLRVEFADEQSGIATGETVLLFDGARVSDAGTATVTSEYVEFEASGLADGSMHVFNVTVADAAGNRATASVSFSLARASADGADEDTDETAADSGDGEDASGTDSGSSEGGTSGATRTTTATTTTPPTTTAVPRTTAVPGTTTTTLGSTDGTTGTPPTTSSESGESAGSSTTDTPRRTEPGTPTPATTTSTETLVPGFGPLTALVALAAALYLLRRD